MAYRKKSKKKTPARSRRRRVSGIGKNSPLLMIGAAAAGYFLGPKLNDAITAKVGTNVDPKMIALAEVLAGYAIPNMLMKNSVPGKVLGGLLMGAGAHLGLKEFNVVSGYSNVPMVSGYQDLRKIAGIDQPVRASGLSSMQVVSGIYDN